MPAKRDRLHRGSTRYYRWHGDNVMKSRRVITDLKLDAATRQVALRVPDPVREQEAPAAQMIEREAEILGRHGKTPL